ncbi:hypothetical protein DFR28_1021149 [Arenicella xantha]|uniref:Uncharacterized protein n=1 Tax=Arenicella xantha TaxID=644221 RepID=A0A395JLP1_9GAMM|nr:hypothetical protein DFR28_1021149 [Arenicella xantha]
MLAATYRQGLLNGFFAILGRLERSGAAAVHWFVSLIIIGALVSISVTLNRQMEFLMPIGNPYKAPSSDIVANNQSEEQQAQTERLAQGQKLIIYAMLLYFVVLFAQAFIGLLGPLLLLGCLLMSIIGLFRVLSVLDSHIVIKILLFILLFVPLINLFVMLRINARATKRLRAEGYTVGLLGARK